MSLALKRHGAPWCIRDSCNHREEVFGEHAEYFKGFGFSLADWRLKSISQRNFRTYLEKTVQTDTSNWYHNQTQRA